MTEEYLLPANLSLAISVKHWNNRIRASSKRGPNVRQMVEEGEEAFTKECRALGFNEKLLRGALQ
jgi:hypothetical protein